VENIMKKLGVLVLGLATLGCGKQNEANPRETLPYKEPPAGAAVTQPSQPLDIPGQSSSDKAGQSGGPLDLAQMKIPTAPVAGKLHGEAFTPDRVELEDGFLTLRQGKDFFADLSVKIVLFDVKDEQSVAGKSYRIKPGNDFGKPHVIMEWRPRGNNAPQSEVFMDNYAMILEFGKAQKGSIPAQIYLSLNDAAKSYVAGTFAVPEAEPAEGGEISGKITLVGKPEGMELDVGCFGKGPKGELECPSAGFKLGGGTLWAACKTWKPRNSKLTWNPPGEVTHQHTNRPPGWYLVYVHGRPASAGEGPSAGLFDWKWIELRDPKAHVTVDLTVDAHNQGTLEVHLVGAPKESLLSVLPLDEQGRLPLPDAHGQLFAGTVKAMDGKAVIPWLREGKYQVGWQATRATAEVKRAMTSTVELKQK
jgi:hypothetical protein